MFPKPTIAVEVGPSALRHLITDDTFVAEQKYDGVRCIAIASPFEAPILLNRRGKVMEAMHIQEARSILERNLRLLGRSVILDGELLSTGEYVAFDLLSLDGVDTRPESLSKRRKLLEAVSLPEGITIPPQALTTTDKLILLKQVKDECLEGIVFKDKTGPYVSWKTRNFLKWKNIQTLDLVITARNTNGKTNAEVSFHGDEVPVAACTMIGKPDLPVGTVVEVAYLTVGQSGRLSQPRILRAREDKRPEECIRTQI